MEKIKRNPNLLFQYTRKLKLELSFIFICYLQFCWGQSTQLPGWILPPKVYNFNTTTLQNLPNGGIGSVTDGNGVTFNNYNGEHATRTFNIQYDPFNANQILFFIVDGKIYNKDGKFLAAPYFDLDYTNLSLAGASQLVIAPIPGDCNQYFIFSAAEKSGNEGNPTIPVFCRLDFSLHNSNYPANIPINGELINVSNDPFNPKIGTLSDLNNAPLFDNSTHNSSIHFAVSRIRQIDGLPTRNVYLASGNHCFHLHLNNLGLSYVNQITTGGTQGHEKSEMELHEYSDGHYSLAIPIFNIDYEGITLIDLATDGTFGNTQTIELISNTNNPPNKAYIKGLEFSQNGRFLYFNHNIKVNYPNPLGFIDLQNNNQISYFQSFNSVQIQEIQYSQLELSSTGRIYMNKVPNAFGNSNGLYFLNDPGNTLNSSNFPQNANLTDANIALDLQVNDFYFPSTTAIDDPFQNSIYLLPSQIDGEVSPIGIDLQASPDITICSNQTISLNVLNPSANLQYDWFLIENGLYLPIATNTPGINVSPSISSTYAVSVNGTNLCGNTLELINVTVAQAPQVSITGATSQCLGNIQEYNIDPWQFPTVVINPVWSIDPPTAGSFVDGVNQGPNVSIDWSNMPSTGATIIIAYKYGPNGLCDGTLTLAVEPCCSMPVSSNNSNCVVASCYGASETSPFPISNLGSSISPNGNCNVVTMDGFIKIDTDFTLDNVDVQLGPNAKIVVDPGITFTIKNNTILRARCNVMWDGIYSKGILVQLPWPSSESIYFGFPLVKISNNCTIQDAQNAIVSEHGGLIEIENDVTFNKNYKHIVIKNYSNSNKNLFYQGYIKERTLFTCKQTSTTLANNTLLAPYQFRNTAVAIEISDVDGIAIGDENTIGKNTFELMTFGINSQRSNLTIKNNLFTDLSNLVNNYSCPCAKGTAICATGFNVSSSIKQRNILIGGAGNNESNEFENLVYGVDVRSNINVQVIENYFANISKKGIKVYDNHFNNSVGHQIVGNNMYNVDEVFIDLSNNICPKIINYNNINLNITSQETTPETYLATGIRVSETKIPLDNPNQNCEIKQNFIKAVKNGILCNFVSNLNISNLNHIELNTSNYNWQSSDHGCGICLSSCEKNSVNDNTIIAANQKNWWVNGIWLADCKESNVTCNAIGHVGFGLRFSGLNYTGSPKYAYLQNQIWNNRMHSNNCGFVLTDGSIGDVKGLSSSYEPLGADNFWTGNYQANNYFHTYVFSSVEYASIPSQFWANTSKLYMKTSGNEYGPSPFFWAAKYYNGIGGYTDVSGNSNDLGVNDVYGYTFQNGNLLSPINGGVAEGSCVDIPCDNGIDLYSNAEMQLDNFGQWAQQNSSMLASNPNQSILWWEKYNLYSAFRKNLSLANTPEKMDFKIQTDQEAIGKLEDIKLMLQDSLHQDSIALLETKMNNNSIVTQNDLETNIKKANDFFAEYLLMQKDSFKLNFSEEQISDMHNMAILCPSIYGPAVYEIRTLLKAIDETSINYLSPCEMALDPHTQEGSNQRRGSISAAQRGDLSDFDEIENLETSIKEVSTIKIFPNPAHSFLQLESVLFEIIRYEITDIYGNFVIFGNENNTKQLNINIGGLASGIYFLKVFHSNQTSQVSKITIVK